MHVNRKYVFELCTSTGSEAFYTCEICIAKFLFSYKDDLLESLNHTTAQWFKNFTSDWRPSLENAVASMDISESPDFNQIKSNQVMYLLCKMKENETWEVIPIEDTPCNCQQFHIAGFMYPPAALWLPSL